jgi:hypothetical protein
MIMLQFFFNIFFLCFVDEIYNKNEEINTSYKPCQPHTFLHTSLFGGKLSTSPQHIYTFSPFFLHFHKTYNSLVLLGSRFMWLWAPSPNMHVFQITHPQKEKEKGRKKIPHLVVFSLGPPHLYFDLSLKRHLSASLIKLKMYLSTHTNKRVKKSHIIFF